MMKTEKVKFYVERNSFGVQAMTILMALSVAFRLIGCWGLWNDRNAAVLQIALPIISSVLLILSVWFLGRHLLWISFIPVVLGAVFFIVKALGFENKVHMILCILLYIAVIVLYFSTVFGIIRTKWILVLLFGLPFLYHIFVEDLPALKDTANPVSFSSGMQEMGVLCIMLGLFFLSLSLKKQIREMEEAELPKMKAPKVLPTQKPQAKQPMSADSTAAEENSSDALSADQQEFSQDAESVEEDG